MKTKIILEMGCNHNGDIKTAYKMIDEAAALKVWGVKFQKRDVDSMPDYLRNRKRNEKNSFGKTYGEHREYLEFNINEIKSLKHYATRRGLKFIVSIFDEVSLNNMLSVGVTDIKLPSQLFNNSRIHDIFSRLSDKIILYGSTGMHTYREIEKSPYLDNFNVVMYCRSIYPCPLEKLDLYTFSWIQDRMNLLTKSVGYSSHDRNGIAIPYIVAMGAEYIERHYTLDKTMKGSDHNTVSSDYKEMEMIIQNIEFIELMLGKVNGELCPEEKAITEMYRSFY